MNSFITGSLIIFYILLSQSIAAFVINQTSPDIIIGECTVEIENNQTHCESASGPTFLETARNVSVTGFDGAPLWFNVIWVGIHAFLLVLALALIIGWIVGVFFGGAS